MRNLALLAGSGPVVLAWVAALAAALLGHVGPFLLASAALTVTAGYLLGWTAMRRRRPADLDALVRWHADYDAEMELHGDAGAALAVADRHARHLGLTAAVEASIAAEQAAKDAAWGAP